MKQMVILFCIFLPLAALEVDTKFSGDVSYNFRTNIKGGEDNAGTEQDKTVDFYNKYTWNIFMKNRIGDAAAINFRLSNPAGYQRNSITDNYWFHDGNSVPVAALAEAYLRWVPGAFSLNAGIIPVKSSTVLTVSWWNDNKDSSWVTAYDKHGINNSVSWKTEENNSKAGIEAAYEFSDAHRVQTRIIPLNDAGKLVTGEDNPASHDKYQFNLASAHTLGGVTLTPAVVLINRKESDSTGIAVTGGLDAAFAVSDAFSAGAGFAAGGYSVEDGAEPLDMMGQLSCKVKTGEKSTLKGKYSLGYQTDRALTGGEEIAAITNHFGLKYVIAPHENITITPRLRGWMTVNTSEESETRSLKLRPAVIFAAQF